MKKFKLVVCFVLVVSLFVGCTANGTKSPAAPVPEEKEMIKVDMSDFGRVDAFSFDCNDSYIAFLYIDMPDLNESDANENDGGMVGSEGDSIENEEVSADGKVYNTHLGVYDIEKDKLVGTTVVDMLAYSLAFNAEDKIQVWMNDEGKISSCLYDTSLNMLGKGKGKPIDRYTYSGEIDKFDTKRFSFTDSLYYNTNSSGYVMLIFPDESGKYYMKKSGETDPVLASYKKLVLEKKSASPDNDDKIILSVNDYENGNCINTVTIDNSETEFFCISKAYLKSKYALYDIIGSDYSTESICCWKYNVNPENSKLEYTVLTDDDFDSKVNEVTKNLKDNYNIDFVMTPECDTKEDENLFFYKWVNNMTCPEYYLYLYDIEYFFSTLPKELYTQMLCKDLEDPVTSFEKQYVYLVGDILEEDTGAYASNKNGDLYIVYSCCDFSYSIFCHELMHNMEYRIWNYYENFDGDWEALNPDGFEYDSDYGNNYYSNEKYEDYFMRDYSTKTLLEDRATTFEAICEASFYSNEKWWEDKNPLNKKVELLIKAITDSYPCAKDINGIKYCTKP